MTQPNLLKRAVLRAERREAERAAPTPTVTTDDTEPDYTVPSTLPHQMLRYGVMWVDDDYGPGWQVRTRDLTTNAAEAELISSRLTGHRPPWDPHPARKDIHAPALDIDNVPVALVPAPGDPDGQHLYLDLPLTWGQYRRLLRALARAGVVDKAWVKQSIRAKQSLLTPPWRVGATNARGHEDAHTDIESRHKLVREHHNPDGSGVALSDVRERGQATYVSSRLIAFKNHGGLHSPAIPLTAPARLVPSSTDRHFHLYLDVPMGWPTYKRLLKALARAGVIEKNWAETSIKTGYTCLRPPWKNKHNKAKQARKGANAGTTA